jgi:hypothetical protein
MPKTITKIRALYFTKFTEDYIALYPHQIKNWKVVRPSTVRPVLLKRQLPGYPKEAWITNAAATASWIQKVATIKNLSMEV